MARLTSAPGRIAPAPSRIRPSPKVADKFYLSKEWRALRAARMLDADYFAAKARADPGERLILDHMVECWDGGDDLDPASTQWLTTSEHQAKRARRRGVPPALVMSDYSKSVSRVWKLVGYVKNATAHGQPFTQINTTYGKIAAQWSRV